MTLSNPFLYKTKRI